MVRMLVSEHFSCRRFISTGNFSVNPFCPVGCSLGLAWTQGPCDQGWEDNYDVRISIIYARLSLEEHRADMSSSIHQRCDAGFLLLLPLLWLELTCRSRLSRLYSKLKCLMSTHGRRYPNTRPAMQIF